eukprot:TRINITY_DN1431_c0_g1_i2.p1 TRINITY_DN1431_c0_g1~~TRINITY_DN1431_c0_g1_i2.p1  ORF type:complete len:192 (-),score=47.63 TRINITY_DN1431_c0_g1_i2:96-671(-)
MGNTVPKSEIGDWKKKYNLPQDKVKLTFRAFKNQKGKNGEITKDRFIEVMTKEGAADEQFANAIFDSFDRDGNGTIDIREYMALMGVSFGGGVDEKLEASFQLFDEDGNGELDKDEVERMLCMVMKSMLRRSGQTSGGEPVLSKKRLKEIKKIVDEIFDKVDANKSGTIDLDEFKLGFNTHPDICNFFKQF